MGKLLPVTSLCEASLNEGGKDLASTYNAEYG